MKRLKELVDGREIRSRSSRGTSSTATSGSSKSKSKRRTTTTCATTASSSRCEEEKDDKKKLYSLLGPTITTDAVAPTSAVLLSCAAASVDALPSSEDGTAATLLKISRLKSSESSRVKSFHQQISPKH